MSLQCESKMSRFFLFWFSFSEIELSFGYEKAGERYEFCDRIKYILRHKLNEERSEKWTYARRSQLHLNTQQSCLSTFEWTKMSESVDFLIDCSSTGKYQAKVIKLLFIFNKLFAVFIEIKCKQSNRCFWPFDATTKHNNYRATAERNCFSRE